MNNFDKFINRFTSDIRTWSEEPRPQDGQICKVAESSETRRFCDTRRNRSKQIYQNDV